MTDAGDIDGVERLDQTLHDLATTNPDATLAIIESLSISDDFTARETAAIFSQYLFPLRPQPTAAILAALLDDPEPDIARQALTSIDELTGDPSLNAAQAAQRITQIRDNDD